MKTLRSSRDIEAEGILEILNESKKCEQGNYPDLKGKIIGILTLRPSLRSTASFMSSALKSGANYINFDVRYVTAGEETMHDTIQSIDTLVDLLTVRTPMDMEITDLTSKVPILNAMAGDEHTTAAIWILYSMWKRWGFSELKGKKVGVYGQVKFSQPMISFYRVWSKLGVEFVEDSIEGEFGSDEKLIENIKSSGGTFEKGKLEEFIDKVDFLVVTEGRPGEGADPKLVEVYNGKYKKINRTLIDRLKDGAYWFYVGPRQLTNGELTVEEALDDHPKLIPEGIMMEESLWVNMALYKYFLEK